MTDESPVAIKNPPLRNPGQSLENEIDKVIHEDAYAWLAVAICIVLYTVAEWIRWFLQDQFHPILLTLYAVGLLGIFSRKLIAVRKKFSRLRTGLLGERYTGNFLQNSLLRRGYWVVHDVVDNVGNIDHVVIGPGGVFSVETKARTKRKGQNRVTYDGSKVLVNGFSPDRDPVAQAKASAKSLQRILRDYAGTSVDVRPVVLFPEWFVEGQPRGAETWVLNEKAFVKFVENEPERLSSEEVFKLAAALGRYVREQNEKTR